MSKQAMQKLRGHDVRYLVHPQTNQYAHRDVGPVIISRGKGLFVYDEHDDEYLDAVAGLWCASLGFSHERLAKVAYEQMRTLGAYHTFRHRSNVPSIELAETLIGLSPVPMSKVLLQGSGSEANDTAIKLAWYYHAAIGRPGKRKIVGRKMSYHGNTCAAASATGRPDMHVDFGLPFEMFRHTEFPHYYKFQNAGETEEAFASRMAAALEELILREGPDTVAAFIAEPVMGAGGCVIPPRTYFDKIQGVLRKYEVLFIADEVICGFGRTGKLWGTQTFNLKPDMISCAKALSAGFLPISALLISEKIYQALVSESEKLGNFAHGYTYAGHPVTAAVALETLKIYEEMDLLAHISRVAPKMQSRLAEFSDHPLVGNVRGVGLMSGIELVIDKKKRDSFDPKLKVGSLLGRYAEQERLIVRVIGDTIAFSPALIVSDVEIDEIASRFKKALDATWKELRSKGIVQ